MQILFCHTPDMLSTHFSLHTANILVLFIFQSCTSLNNSINEFSITIQYCTFFQFCENTKMKSAFRKRISNVRQKFIVLFERFYLFVQPLRITSFLNYCKSLMISNILPDKGRIHGLLAQSACPHSGNATVHKSRL